MFEILFEARQTPPATLYAAVLSAQNLDLEYDGVCMM